MGVSQKTNRVLHFISLCLLLILIRSWYLSTVQHDFHVNQAKKPQRRVIIEKADRGTIYDRFGIPMAVNKIQYNAAVRYADIRQIPTSIWKREGGKKIRIAARSNYIEELSKRLSFELGLDRIQIEDMIHGKAAVLPHTPFVIKEGLSEEQYYRLKMLEKDWLGLQAQRTSKRYYPWGKVGCDVLGYLGHIDSEQYLKIAHELRVLEKYLGARYRNENPFLPEGFSSPDEVYKRFIELQEKAYTMNDLVGKSGVEASYENDLRGYSGKHVMEVDIKGNCLKETPGSRKSLPGKNLTLTLSAELQDFAEKLLAASEGSKEELSENWMRGGAIVAMIPKTGEIVAFASYPRFDPNDFIPTRDLDFKKEKDSSIRKWLENETYIGAIWEGRKSLEREYFSFIQGKYLEEKVPMTWDRYLQMILPGNLKTVMERIHDLNLAIEVQTIGPYHPLFKELSENDRLLILDLCHLNAPKGLFSPELLSGVGDMTMSNHHLDQQEALRLLGEIKEDIQDLFHRHDFAAWRKEHFKTYLRQKRKEEKQQKGYARPYTDYLDKIEQKLFKAFWNAYKPFFLYNTLTGQIPSAEKDLQFYFEFLRHKTVQESSLGQKIKNLKMPLAIEYLKSLRSFDELVAPLQATYSQLRSSQGKKLEKHLAAAFYPLYGYGFTRAQCFRQTSAQGSVFKIITSYQALWERYQQQKDFNFLTIIDDLRGYSPSHPNKQILGYNLDGTPLYRLYKGGILPRSSHTGIGKIDLTGALEQSSNVYFALLAGDFLEDPKNLALAAKAFNFGEKTGIDLPNEAKGNLPSDLDQNRTGLYSFAIGQHTLEVTPLQTAVMLAAFANRGAVIKPHVLKQLEGPERTLKHEILSDYSIDQILTTTKDEEKIVRPFIPKIERTVPLPTEVFHTIADGLRKVVSGSRGTARPAVMRNFYDHPQAISDYIDMHKDMIAKTGTAQVRFKQTVAKSDSAVMKDNIWFGAIAYPPGHLLEKPELVVAVYLRFRQGGREGGPIAAQVIKKWREINSRKST